jgi:hypothetical protein
VRRKNRGQAITESILVLPLFLVLVVGGLQLAQLGMAIVISNYAASSIARKAVSEQSFSATATGAVNLANYDQKAKSLMTAGMQVDDPHGLVGCVIQQPGNTSPTAELHVAVRTKLSAWPVFAQLLHTVWLGTYDAQPLACLQQPSNPGGFGPFNFSAQAPYYFYVTGEARVQTNYVP